MNHKYQFHRSITILVSVIIMFTLTACGDIKALVTYFSDHGSDSSSSSSIDPTITPVPTFTEIPSSPTPEPTSGPCDVKLLPADGIFPNPQENLDPAAGTTWMALKIEKDLLWLLSGEYTFHYWWDTRAFEKIDSFNVGDGPCEALPEEGMILCEGLPLKGTSSIPTGGYEYSFNISIPNLSCKPGTGPIYQQIGLIFLKTGEHDVYWVNGTDAP